jgi:TonB-dependent starch-binding outer membrane protein SusC
MKKNYSTQTKGILVLWMMLMATFTFAQNRVTGKVSDAAGSGIPGATVLVKGTNNGTTSDGNGNYSISAAENSTLVVSSIGFKSQEVQVGNRSVINFSLDEDASSLSEVVVTGYQTLRKKDISGSVAVINTADLQNVVASSFAQKLQGRAAGVQVSTSGRPGDATNVRIRGISSFRGNNPLWIIDGVQVVDQGNLNINPNDIESMQVLKDASAMSIYGSRASNGVIVITTKQGKSGKTKLSYNGSVSSASAVKGLDDILITDSAQYLDMMKQYYGNAGAALPDYVQNGQFTKYIFPATNGDPGAYDRLNNPVMLTSAGTNWWKEVTRPGTTQDHSLMATGGNEFSTFAIGGGYLNQKGYFKYNDFTRYNLRANSSFKIGKKFKVGENLNIARRKIMNNIAQQEGGVLGQIYKMSPMIPVYDQGTSVDEDGIRNSFGGSRYSVTLGNASNPLSVLYRGKDNINNNTNILGNVYAEYEVIKGLTLSSRYNVDLGFFNNKGFSYLAPEHPENRGAQNFNEFWNTNSFQTWTNTAAYNTTLAEKHNINVLLGYEASKSQYREIAGSVNNYFTTSKDIWYLNTAFGQADTRQIRSGGNEGRLLSQFAKVDYNLGDKYYLSGTIRRDGSSNFSKANQYGIFPAFSAAWRVSGESFMKDLSALSDLKLRASWGKTGNQDIPSYNSYDRWGGNIGSAFYAIDGSNGAATTGYHLTNIGSDGLGAPTKWEEAISTNVGLDASLFNNKISVVFDVYKRKSVDLLYNPELPGTVGFIGQNAPFRNVAEMDNTGFDLAIGYKNKTKSGIGYSVDLNIGKYKNEIIKIFENQQFFFPNAAQGRIDNRLPQQININRLGYSISSFHGYKLDGKFNSQADLDALDMPSKTLGGLRFKDLNGDKKITDEDLTIIGSPHPDLFGGMNLGLNVKKFDITAFFVGSLGNEIFNYTRIFTHFRQFDANVSKDFYLNNGKGDNPKLNRNDIGSRASSEYYVEDASYLRLGQLQIAYSIPMNKFGLSNLKVYGQGQNLFTLTKYTGLDPVLSNANIGDPNTPLNDLWTGFDIGQVPSSRLFTFGVVADF